MIDQTTRPYTNCTTPLSTTAAKDQHSRTAAHRDVRHRRRARARPYALTQSGMARASHPLLEYLAGGARHEGVVDSGGAARRREHGLHRG